MQAQLLKLDNSGTGVDFIDFVNREFPGFVGKPRLIKINLQCFLLSEARRDFYVLRKGNDGTLCSYSKNADRFVTSARSSLPRTDYIFEFCLFQAPCIINDFDGLLSFLKPDLHIHWPFDSRPSSDIECIIDKLANRTI